MAATATTFSVGPDPPASTRRHVETTFTRDPPVSSRHHEETITRDDPSFGSAAPPPRTEVRTVRDDVTTAPASGWWPSWSAAAPVATRETREVTTVTSRRAPPPPNRHEMVAFQTGQAAAAFSALHHLTGHAATVLTDANSSLTALRAENANLMLRLQFVMRALARVDPDVVRFRSAFETVADTLQRDPEVTPNEQRILDIIAARLNTV
jgi:hypothetical protein